MHVSAGQDCYMGHHAELDYPIFAKIGRILDGPSKPRKVTLSGALATLPSLDYSCGVAATRCWKCTVDVAWRDVVVGNRDKPQMTSIHQNVISLGLGFWVALGLASAQLPQFRVLLPHMETPWDNLSIVVRRRIFSK